MKIRVMSDLHLEGAALEPETVDCDVVVLAGDIDQVVRGSAARWARQSFPETPIIWVLGNHEYYRWNRPTGMDGCLARARELARAHDVLLLENESVVVGTVRFLGCTLWTDFRLQGTPEGSMTRARLGMSDFSGRITTIGDDGELRDFRPQDSREIHRRSVAWLRGELAEEFGGATVVVTHHSPHPICEHRAYASSLLSPAFCSNLGAMIEEFQPELWISGHTHASHDVRIGKTRLVSNQRGYTNVPEHDDAPFDPRFCVEVREPVNAHLVLDELRLQLAKEVLRTSTVEEVRRRSLANLARWEGIGTWGPLYADWRSLLMSGTDEQVIAVMTGTDDRAVQLRQSMPYVGILSKDTVERLRLETTQRMRGPT